MKRNDMGDSCVFGRCTERLCRHANHWKCPVVMVSIPLARRHGKQVVWRRRLPLVPCDARYMLMHADNGTSPHCSEWLQSYQIGQPAIKSAPRCCARWRALTDSGGPRWRKASTLVG